MDSRVETVDQREKIRKAVRRRHQNYGGEWPGMQALLKRQILIGRHKNVAYRSQQVEQWPIIPGG